VDPRERRLETLAKLRTAHWYRDTHLAAVRPSDYMSEWAAVMPAARVGGSRATPWELPL